MSNVKTLKGSGKISKAINELAKEQEMIRRGLKNNTNSLSKETAGGIVERKKPFQEEAEGSGTVDGGVWV